VSNHVNLSGDEKALIDETAPNRLTGLDEHALKDLESRIRKARDKNFSLLRREGAARVSAEGARGSVEQANQRRVEKIDVLDEALARVGARLEAVRGAQYLRSNCLQSNMVRGNHHRRAGSTRW
jgi:hypothetical protein